MIGTAGMRERALLEVIFGGAESEGLRRTADPALAVPVVTIQNAANLFKTLGHDGRLLILCHLIEGEKSVNELESILDARQSAVSQQLARLRMEGLVSARRDGQTIFYTIKDQRIGRLLAAFAAIFAGEDAPAG
jgi:ArsR family transcriptional regulator